MIVEARQMTVYVHTVPGRATRRRSLVRRVAYMHAAWTKLRARCGCALEDQHTCRYHNPMYRATDPEDGWENPLEFKPPRIWGLRTTPSGGWTYGRAVAHRLARFYQHLDRKAAP